MFHKARSWLPKGTLTLGVQSLTRDLKVQKRRCQAPDKWPITLSIKLSMKVTDSISPSLTVRLLRSSLDFNQNTQVGILVVPCVTSMLRATSRRQPLTTALPGIGQCCSRTCMGKEEFNILIEWQTEMGLCRINSWKNLFRVSDHRNASSKQRQWYWWYWRFSNKEDTFVWEIDTLRDDSKVIAEDCRQSPIHACQ